MISPIARRDLISIRNEEQVRSRSEVMITRMQEDREAVSSTSYVWSGDSFAIST